jgi:hypothetical protein
LEQAFNNSGFPIDTTWCPESHADEVDAFATIVSDFSDDSVEYSMSMRNVFVAIDAVLHGDEVDYGAWLCGAWLRGRRGFVEGVALWRAWLCGRRGFVEGVAL